MCRLATPGISQQLVKHKKQGLFFLFSGTEEVEPRLVIYDGHLSHVCYETIQLARKQNITLLKLPAHTTDLLQPLDVSVCKSLKEHWGKILFQRVNLKRSRLS